MKIARNIIVATLGAILAVFSWKAIERVSPDLSSFKGRIVPVLAERGVH